jgi:hypothetical protein
MVKNTSTNTRDTKRKTPHVINVVPQDLELCRSRRTFSLRSRSKLLATASWASFKTLSSFSRRSPNARLLDLSCAAILPKSVVSSSCTCRWCCRTCSICTVSSSCGCDDPELTAGGRRWRSSPDCSSAFSSIDYEASIDKQKVKNTSNSYILSLDTSRFVSRNSSLLCGAVYSVCSSWSIVAFCSS